MQEMDSSHKSHDEFLREVLPYTPPPSYEEACLPGEVDPAPPLQPGYNPTLPLYITTHGAQQSEPSLPERQRMPEFGDDPVRLKCPHCNSIIVTRLTKQPGTLSYIAAIFLCCFFWPLACVPFCMCEDWHDVIHKCPNCKSILGERKGQL